MADRQSSSRTRGVELLGLNLSPYDLDRIKSLAMEHYLDHGSPDVARSWVAALNTYLLNMGIEPNLNVKLTKDTK